jgi:hypothetical protein
VNLTFTSPADHGLLQALKLVKSPGVAIEFGMGTGRNLRECAKKGFDCTGYDVNDWVVEQVREQFDKYGIRAKVLNQDVLDINFQRSSLTVAIVGTTIFWPKSIVESFLKKLWVAIKPNGILHIEFATPKDGTHKSEFLEYMCAPIPGSPNSYCHSSVYCGYCDEHPGVLGASYWQYSEIVGLLNRLGKWQSIARKVDDWHQVFTDGSTLFRSFDRVTVKKVS